MPDIYSRIKKYAIMNFLLKKKYDTYDISTNRVVSGKIKKDISREPKHLHH